MKKIDYTIVMKEVVSVVIVLVITLFTQISLYADSISGFENPLSCGWNLVSEAEIVAGNSHSGNYCLRLGIMGRAVLSVSNENVYGRVTFWVKDSMTQVPSATSPKVGPVFGLENKDHETIFFGVFRASYLNLNNYGYNLNAENNFYNLWNTGIPRTAGWQKWTIEVTAPGQLNVYVNDVLYSISDSKKQFFSKGFTRVVFKGDYMGGPEVFYFDDVKVEITGPGQNDTHPFPSPRTLSSPLRDPNFFPVAVWVQPIEYIDYYKLKGVNLFIGEGAQAGVTRNQFLDALAAKGIYGIIHPGDNTTADTTVIASLKNHPALLGWMHGDEPDNAPGGVQKRTPAEVKQLYENIGALDTQNPVYLNLGCGVGNPEKRQTVTTNYYGYCEGADIISYDIYPVASYPQGEKVLYFVADGIDRLRTWSGNRKPIWVLLEASDIGGYRSPAPQEMRAEVWMSIIHGADGIGWFPHVFNPYAWKDIPPELEVEMANIGQTLGSLAPIINSPERDDVSVELLMQGRLDVKSRLYNNKLYFFAVNMMNKPVRVRFILPQTSANGQFDVINESRTVQASDTEIIEEFLPFEVHLYEQVSQANVMYGDVNADGDISAYDAALAAHIAVELEHSDIKNRAAAEVSGDAEVSAYDAALIAQKAVGLIEKFPVE